MSLNETQQALCDESDTDFSALSALFLNCTLKPSPQSSHTRTLMDTSAAIMRENDVDVEIIRPVDLDLAPGVYGDMTEHGAEADDWPALYQKVLDANILVLGSPIWLGEKSSVCQRVIERLYGNSGDLNEEGQYAYYGRAAGCLITGNEDGSRVGFDNDFTQRNTTFMTWNLMHTALQLHEAGGVPAHGNQRSEWEAGCRFDHPNPEHR